MPDPENMPRLPLTEGQKKIIEMLEKLPDPPMLPEEYLEQEKEDE